MPEPQTVKVMIQIIKVYEVETLVDDEARKVYQDKYELDPDEVDDSRVAESIVDNMQSIDIEKNGRFVDCMTEHAEAVDEDFFSKDKVRIF